MRINSRGSSDFRNMIEYVAMLICIIILLSCGRNNIKYISIPYDFTSDNNIFLGQDIDELKKRRNMIYETSIFGYYEEMDNNLYFNMIYYNSGLGGFVSNPDKLLRITLENDIKVANILTDSLAYEIFKKCCDYYGKEYTITYLDNLRYSDSTKWRPKIIWKSDSCYVSFIFTPKSYYDSFLKEGKRPFAMGFILEITSPDYAGDTTNINTERGSIKSLFQQ